MRLPFPVIDFVSSRTQSIKSRATGLIVLPFKVIIPTGSGTTGNFTGRTLIEGCLSPKRTMNAGRIAR